MGEETRMKLMRVLSTTLIVVAFLSATTSLSAGDKSPEVGYIKDGIYHDARFGYSIKIPVEWREAKLRKELTPERLLLVQKKPKVPLRLQNSPELAARPTVMIFADSTAMSPQEFFAFLRADTGKTEFKNRILSKSVLLDQGTASVIQILQKTTAKILGQEAIKLGARLEYTVRVESPTTSAMVQVNGFRVGYIYIVPFSGWLMYIEVACENEYLESLQPDFDAMINSLTLEGTGK
jgi:hypothetical protein